MACQLLGQLAAHPVAPAEHGQGIWQNRHVR